ncbi:MAG: M23 family metallopeptidase [Anaerolineales bacterium]|nr:M23 family metallopeptidase [Chloroflexota bacterium]MBL6982956.1 M23 family metallopeptidase [Anaerolineales bacterium]
MKWTSRLFVGSFLAIPFLCGLFFVIIYIALIALTIPQLPAWAQDDVIEWMLGVPKEVGTEPYDIGAAEYAVATDDLDWLETHDYVPAMFASQGVPWDDFIHPNDLSLPDGIPFDHAPLVNCLFGDPNYPNHSGVDFPEPGGTEVFSTMAGKVVWADWNGPWGNLVVVENIGIQTYYAHLRAIDVIAGQIIPVGELVGEVGTTGLNAQGEPTSTGDHLHYGIKERTGEDSYVWRNPADYFGEADLLKIRCPED